MFTIYVDGKGYVRTYGQSGVTFTDDVDEAHGFTQAQADGYKQWLINNNYGTTDSIHISPRPHP